MKRRILSIVLVLAMILSMVPTSVFAADVSADDDGIINYVSIGDSMTNGYGLDGYTAEAGVYDYGYASYANQFAAALAGMTPEEFTAAMATADQGFGLKFEKDGVTVNHAQLGLSAARPEDVSFLLNLKYDSQEVIDLLNKYPDNDLVCWSCGDHSGVPFEDIVYCAVCKWDPALYPQFDLPGYGVQRGDGKSVDDYEAWWTLVQGKKWNELIGYGDFWTWKELVEDYRFGTVATYIKSIFGTDAEKQRAAELMASRPAKPRDDGSNGEETVYVAKHFQEQIANADVVSLGIGNGNFGVWLMGRITTVLMDYDGVAANYVYQIEDALNQLDKNDPLRKVIENALVEVDPYVDEYVAKMMGDGLDADLAASIKDVCTYAVVSFMINYKSMVESILRLNPDVEIVELGLMNTYAGDDAMATEGQVTIGNILDVMFPPLSAYVAALPTLLDKELKAEATFYYAEEYTIECLIQNFGNEEFYNWVGVARDRFVTGVVGECDCGGGHNTDNAESCGDWDYGIFWELLDGFDMGGITVERITPYQIKAYEALDAVGKVKYAIENKDKAGSIAVYLAIEDAICKSGRLAPVTLSTLTGLELGNPAILSKALSNFTAEQEKVIADYYADAKAGLIAYGIPEAVITQTNINDMSMILSLPVALSNALWTDTELCSMLAVVARNKLGNGLGAHPSVAGHAALAEEMINAYNGGYTAEQKTIENALALIKEYYDEAYAFAYDYAVAEGYVAEAVAEIDSVIAKLQAIDVSDTEMTEAFKAEVAVEIEKVVEILESVKDMIYEIDELDQASVDALLAVLIEAGDAIAHVEHLLVQAAVDVNRPAIVSAMREAHRVLVEKVIPQIDKQLQIAVKVGDEWLKTKMGEAYEELVEAVIEALPYVDEALYNWLYNNPEKVLAFFTEYGDEFETLVEKYGSDVVAVLGYLVYTYGEEIADFVVNNSEDVLKGMVEWYETYGERVWNMIDKYLDELGVYDALAETGNKLLDKAESVKAEIEKQVDELKAQLDELKKELAEKKAELEKTVGAVKAEIEAAIAEIEAAIAEVEAAIAKLEQQIADISERVAELRKAIIELNAAVEQAIVDGYTALAELKAAVEAFSAAVITLAKALPEEIMAALGEAGEYLLNATLEAIKKYAPELDEALYSWLYDNAELVIATFGKYSDEILGLVEEFGEEVLAVVAVVLYNCGEDMLVYIIENNEEVLANLKDWMNAYGEKTVKLLQVYAEALGLCDAVREQIAELEALLEELKAELEDANIFVKAQIKAQIAKIEKQIAELKAELEKLQAQIDALIKELITEVNAKVEDLIAEVEKTVAEIEKLVTEQLQEAVEKLQAMVEAQLDAAAAAIAAKIAEGVAALEALLAKADEAVLNAINELVDALEQLYYDATHFEYVVDEDSYYVSLGDSTVTGMNTGDPAYGNFGYKAKVPTSAPYKLAEALGLDVETQYEQLALAGLRLSDLRYILDETFVPDEYTLTRTKDRVDYYAGGYEQMRADYVAALSKADLVTISIGNCNFTDFISGQVYGALSELINTELSDWLNNKYFGAALKEAISQFVDLDDKPYEMDWEGYIGTEGVAELEKLLAEVKAQLIEKGIPEVYTIDVAVMLELDLDPGQLVINIPVADLAVYMMESYLYGYATFALNYAEVFNKIHEIAPEAELVILGMYNPNDELVLHFNDITIPFGDGYGYLLKALNAHFLGYAMVTPKTTFVSVYGTESFTDVRLEEEGSEYDLMDYMVAFGENAADFHATAAGHTYMKDQILNAVIVKKAEAYLLGDVNMDGSVDSLDTNILYRYANEDESLGALSRAQLILGDVNMDGMVDSLDTNVLYRYAYEDASLSWVPVEVSVNK